MYVKPTPTFTWFFVCSSTLQHMHMQTSANIEKHIVEEEHLANWQTSEERRLEISNPKPLAIEALDEETRVDTMSLDGENKYGIGTKVSFY